MCFLEEKSEYDQEVLHSNTARLGSTLCHWSWDGGLNAFNRYHIFALDSVVVQTQNWTHFFSSMKSPTMFLTSSQTSFFCNRQSRLISADKIALRFWTCFNDCHDLTHIREPISKLVI